MGVKKSETLPVESRAGLTLHSINLARSKLAQVPAHRGSWDTAPLAHSWAAQTPDTQLCVSLQSPRQRRRPCGESLMIHKIHMYVLRRDELCSRQRVGARAVISVRLRPTPWWQAKQTNFTLLGVSRTKQDVKMPHHGGGRIEESEEGEGWS